jgi:AAA+ ATPase superfamily predicted ATPase
MFTGRQTELTHLEELYRTSLPSLVVLRGRRRIGKSRLIAEFAAKHPEHSFWNFSGLPPTEGTTAQTQR